jgi:hypothetical protein
MKVELQQPSSLAKRGDCRNQDACAKSFRQKSWAQTTSSRELGRRHGSQQVCHALSRQTLNLKITLINELGYEHKPLARSTNDDGAPFMAGRIDSCWHWLAWFYGLKYLNIYTFYPYFIMLLDRLGT